MNVREMHIEINQSLQKVAANRTRKFLPEELDLVLNKVQGRYIQSKLKERKDGSGGFEVDQMGTDALRPLIVTNKVLPAYLSSTGRYVAYLPPDYSHLLSDSSDLHSYCFTKKAPPTTEQQTITLLRQDMSYKAGEPYYLAMSIVLRSRVNIPDDLPYNNTYKGYSSKQDISFLTPYLLLLLRRTGANVYWERFADMHYPSTYILVGTNTSNSLMKIDGIVMTQSSVQTRDMKRTLGGTVIVPNRLTASNDVPTLLTTAFYRTSDKSPVSELASGTLYTYTDDSFIVSNTVVSYLRKPQPISLLLGTDCELAEDYHPALCDLSVEYLKGTLENQVGHGMKASDNERRVII